MAENYVGRRYALELNLGTLEAVPMLTTWHVRTGTQVWWAGSRRPLPAAPTQLWLMDELYLALLDCLEAHTHLS